MKIDLIADSEQIFQEGLLKIYYNRSKQLLIVKRLNDELVIPLLVKAVSPLKSFEKHQGLKVVKAIRHSKLPVRAIRCFIPELGYEVDSCSERGEDPKLFIKLTSRIGGECEVAFLGRRHLEKFNYYTKDPEKWISFGLISLNREQVEKLMDILVEMLVYWPDRGRRDDRDYLV